ncbi:MAG: carboxypeptidase-like regulatory domain-containing protein [Pyrinomonadaceae bacterium]
MKVRNVIIALIVFAGSVTSALGNAVTAAAPVPGKIESQRLRWKGKTVKIAISNSLTRFSPNIKTDSDVLGGIRRSFQAWTNAADIDLQLEFSDRQSVSPNGPAGDGISLITIAQSPDNVLFFSKDSDSASAKTRIFFNRRGFITEADIVLNPFQQFSTDGTFGTFDLESTLTHEIGHLLGLHHLGVLGSTMADSFARNGTMGFADFGPRTLSGSDITAIRDLYGAPSEAEDCCAVISGKLVTGASRPAKNLEVWAEESQSGRVVAQVETSVDGTFRIGGLPGGDYSLYWKTNDASSTSAMGKLDVVSLEAKETKIINEKVILRQSDIALQYLGRNGQLADYGIPLSAGRSFMINLGGKNLDDPSARITFSSPLIKLSQFPISAQEFSEGVSGVSFVITVDTDIEPGNYSVFINGKDGPVSCLIGALGID